MADQELSIIDEERLRLLSLGYKISASIAAMFSLFALFYVFIGFMMTTTLSHSAEASRNPAQALPPAFVGWIFGAIGLGMFAAMIAVAAAARGTGFAGIIPARHVRRDDRGCGA